MQTWAAHQTRQISILPCSDFSPQAAYGEPVMGCTLVPHVRDAAAMKGWKLRQRIGAIAPEGYTFLSTPSLTSLTFSTAVL